GTRQRLDGAWLQEQVGPRLDFVSEFQAGSVDHACKLFNPPRFKTENIVAHPEVIGPRVIEKPSDFANNMRRRPGCVSVTVNGFGAPVALERASAGCGDIEGKISMMAKPDCAVGFYIHQVPGGPGQRIEIPHHGAGRVPA